MASVADQLEKETRRDTIDAIEEMLVGKAEAIEQLLTSKEAWNIYHTTFGERFDRLYEKRRALYRKASVIYNICEEINKMRH